jgi:hypothetical protein
MQTVRVFDVSSSLSKARPPGFWALLAHVALYDPLLLHSKGGLDGLRGYDFFFDVDTPRRRGRSCVKTQPENPLWVLRKHHFSDV